MWFLALRQLRARPQQTALTFLAVALGAAGYVSFSGLIMGMREYLTDQLINSEGQIKILPRDEPRSEQTFRGVFFQGARVFWRRAPSGRISYNRLSSAAMWSQRLDSDEEVLAWAPQLSRQGFVFHTGQDSGVRLVGIDPLRHGAVTTLEERVVVGRLRDLAGASAGVLAGQALLEKLGLQPGDRMLVGTPGKVPQPFTIRAVFRTGNKAIDEGVLYFSLPVAQRLTGASGEISEIVVKIRDPMRAAELAGQWSQGSLDLVQSWDQANANVFEIFKMQDVFFNSITGIILLIVAFGIYNILNMVVNQKKGEIAILKSYGFNQSEIIRLFLYQGILLGILGGLVGLALGALTNSWLETIEVNRSGFGRFATMRTLLVSWSPMIYVKSFAITFVAALISSYLPARQGGRLSPIEIIRGAQ